MSVIVLIRRCVRPGHEDAFLADYRSQSPVDHPAFRWEHLTRLNSHAELHPALRTFDLGSINATIYVNVAHWDSVEAFEQKFEEHFDAAPKDYEAAPRVRAVLDVELSTSGLSTGT